jgi:hypothetical protein
MILNSTWSRACRPKKGFIKMTEEVGCVVVGQRDDVNSRKQKNRESVDEEMKIPRSRMEKSG